MVFCYRHLRFRILSKQKTNKVEARLSHTRTLSRKPYWLLTDPLSRTLSSDVFRDLRLFPLANKEG